MDVATSNHILLFEDSGITQLILEELEEKGLRVSLATNRYIAQTVLANGGVDLLIAEVARLGEDAHDVAEHAVSLSIPCLLISDAREVRRSFEHAVVFVDKRFTLEQLSRQVTEILIAPRVPSSDK